MPGYLAGCYEFKMPDTQHSYLYECVQTRFLKKKKEKKKAFAILKSD